MMFVLIALGGAQAEGLPTRSHFPSVTAISNRGPRPFGVSASDSLLACRACGATDYVKGLPTFQQPAPDEFPANTDGRTSHRCNLKP